LSVEPQDVSSVQAGLLRLARLAPVLYVVSAGAWLLLAGLTFEAGGYKHTASPSLMLLL
jgi:hypothetical protein